MLARLEREGLTPSEEADRITLLRRVTYDLTGLPPTPAEVDAFLADRSPDAYEKRVDALLQSPRYGERMAMPWLDAARYADTHGYHIDSLRGMWPWRDWVIDAFNRNLSFDQFVIEQLAGDLLPNATREQKVASGFNRNHMINFEGGAIAEEYQVEYVIDRVEATSSAFMGLTMGCARCHSHKFDPISHKEFYQFYAFFNNVPERGLDGRTGNAAPFLQLPTPDQQKRIDELDAAIRRRDRALADAVVAPLQREWEKTLTVSPAAGAIDGLTAHYELDGSFSDLSGRYQHGRTVAGDPTFGTGRIGRAASFDGDTEVSFGTVGAFDRADTFSLAVWLRGRGNLPMAVFQKLDNGQRRRGYEWNFDDVALVGIQRWAARLTIAVSSDAPGDGLRIRTRERLRLGDWYHIALTYDGSGKASGLRLYVDGKPFDTEVLQDSLSGPMATDAPLRIGSKALGTPFVGEIDDLRLYRRVLPVDQIRQLAVDDVPRAIVSGVTGKRTPAEVAEVRDYFLTYAAPEALRTAHSELKALRLEKQDLDRQIPTAMVMSELAKPRETFVLARGDYRNQTEKVQPGVPAMLPPLPKDAAATRLSLAKWLVDPAHPLTARVAVNRFWQMYFGTGIVKTQEDFGVQGEPPVHPELLDWLATEFIRTGWDTRAMQRLIVTSATYRQSSKVTAALLEKDPENRLLARASRVAFTGGDDSRHGAGGVGSAERRHRRTERLPVSTGRVVGRDGVRRGILRAGVRTKSRQGSVPARHVHLLEAHRAAGVPGHLRCARSREVHGSSCADQHAAASARADERSDVCRSRARDGATRAARRSEERPRPPGSRLSPRHRADADRQGARRAQRPPPKATGDVRSRPAGGTEARERRRVRPRSARRSRDTRGLDRRREHDPESGRNDHQTIGTPMSIQRDLDLHLTRRQLFGLTARGIGVAALGSLLGSNVLTASQSSPAARNAKTGGLTSLPHFTPKAKRVIFLHQSGGPSQLETFDYKPALAKYQGTQIPDSVRQGQRVAQTMGQSLLPVASSPFGFAQHGKSGTWVSDLLPHTARIVDDITVIKTMYTDAINHDPAITFIQTGFQQPGRPSMGAWLSYGLGSENQTLPSFVVLLSQAHAINADQPLFSRLWASGFLPSSYQGVRFRGGSEPVLFLEDPPGVKTTTRREMLDAVAALNGMKHAAYGDPEIETRIAQYEMAYRMQTSVPDLMDLSKEPDSVFEMYGPESRKPGTYAANCLLARRLAERDVRFIQLYHRGWDQHNDLPRDLALQCKGTDQPTAALVDGPETARPARRHAGRVGRRVRAHGIQSGQADRRQLRPRPPSAQLLHVGRRRRHEGGVGARRDRRIQLQHRRRTRSRSSTCRRRSCTCSASITRN